MSTPAHRSTRHSTLITTQHRRQHQADDPGGHRRKDVESRAQSNNQGCPSNGRSVQLRVGLEAPVWNDVTGPPPPHFHPSGAASPEAMISYEGKRTHQHTSIHQIRSTVTNTLHPVILPARQPHHRQDSPVVQQAVNHPGFGRDSLLGSGDQADQVAQLVQGLELNRWPASAGSVQATVVVPIHPCRGGDVDFLNSMPWPARFNQLGLVQAYQ